MKTYIYINPINNKPYEFSSIKNEEQSIANNEILDDGTYGTKLYKPIILEIQEYDSLLLKKTYNPDTKLLE